MGKCAANPTTAATEARAHGHGLAHLQLLDAREVARLLCISLPTLWRYVKQERIPQPVRRGPRVVGWRLRDTELFIGEGEVA